MAQLHVLKRPRTNASKKRVGRGGLRGKTSGRGMKGQKARAGHSLRPNMRDIIKKIPKRRGHGINRARTVNSERIQAKPVNLTTLESTSIDGEVTPATLVAAGVVKKQGGKLPTVKILGLGTLTKKLTVFGCRVSKTAQAAIEKAGGSVK